MNKIQTVENTTRARSACPRFDVQLRGVHEWATNERTFFVVFFLLICRTHVVIAVCGRYHSSRSLMPMRVQLV